MKKLLLLLPACLLLCGRGMAAAPDQAADFGQDTVSSQAGDASESHPAYFFGSDEPLPVFSPGSPLTRAHAAQILRVLLSDPAAGVSFSDRIGAEGAVPGLPGMDGSGLENETGDLDTPLTRAEFTRWLLSFFPLRADAEPFADVLETHEAFAAICSARAYGWVQGDENGRFRPDEPMTRVEAVVMLNRALGRVPDQGYIASKKPVFYRDVSPENWYYYEVMEACVPHECHVFSVGEQWTAHTAPAPAPEEGFYWIGDQLYYFDSESKALLKDVDAEFYSFDASGKFSAKSTRLDRKAREFAAAQEGARLRLSEMETMLAEAAQSEEEWSLMLINRDHPLPEGFAVPELTALDNGYLIDSRVYPALQQMLADARAAGYSPLVCSAYRTWEKQTALNRQRVERFLRQGYSREKAEEAAAFWVARPGTSEHQAGLAVDIVDSAYPVLNRSQENRPVQQWLMTHCAEYGFILRYPTDRSNLTGVGYEPWHYRYVGVEAAAEIMSLGICLEEYLDS